MPTDLSNFEKQSSDAHFVSFLFHYFCIRKLCAETFFFASSSLKETVNCHQIATARDLGKMHLLVKGHNLGCFVRSYLYHYFERQCGVRAFLHAHLESTIPVKVLVSLKGRNKGF